MDLHQDMHNGRQKQRAGFAESNFFSHLLLATISWSCLVVGIQSHFSFLSFRLNIHIYIYIYIDANKHTHTCLYIYIYYIYIHKSVQKDSNQFFVGKQYKQSHCWQRQSEKRFAVPQMAFLGTLPAQSSSIGHSIETRHIFLNVASQRATGKTRSEPCDPCEFSTLSATMKAARLWRATQTIVRPRYTTAHPWFAKDPAPRFTWRQGWSTSCIFRH